MTTSAKIVDLTQYRRELERARAEELEPEPERAPAPLPTPPHPRRSAWMRRRGLTLDHLASLGMLVMALAFALRILFS